jgi:ankyrin repeat protein
MMKEKNEINAKFLPFIKALQERAFYKARTLIIKEGIDLNQIIDEDSGDTYLHWAVKKGDRDVITFLLNNKVNVNSINKNNETLIITLRCFALAPSSRARIFRGYHGLWLRC